MMSKFVIDEELVDRIVELVESGVGVDNACIFENIDCVVFYNFLNDGRIEKEKRDAGKRASKSLDLNVVSYGRVMRANISNTIYAEQRIQLAIVEGDEKIARWFLERTNPSKYGSISDKVALQYGDFDTKEIGS